VYANLDVFAIAAVLCGRGDLRLCCEKGAREGKGVFLGWGSRYVPGGLKCL
jgi:hypothetical protein